MEVHALGLKSLWRLTFSQYCRKQNSTGKIVHREVSSTPKKCILKVAKQGTSNILLDLKEHFNTASQAGALTGSNRDAKLEPPSMLSRTVGREMLNSAICRTTMKDTTSSKLSVQGPKQADAVHKAELMVLRNEIKALPEGLREDARMNYLLDQNIKRKDLQDFQCSMIGKVEAILRKNITESGQDYRKYKVGGYDKGTYERFFRVEPARYMSKAQLTTALRRSFGDTVIKSESAIGKLFDSFDFNRTDEMDWRAFLYMLSMLMQPYLYCNALLRWGYAIYSSVGSLDLDCIEPLSLAMVKDMICVPVILSMRSYVKHAFDSAWLELSCTDTDTVLYAARKTSSVAARAADPDDLKITFKILNKILTMTPFSKFMSTATVYGLRDSRPWTCVLEEQYYHPRVLKELKVLRREERNNGEADKFIATRMLRIKKYSINIWCEYTRQRNFLRYVLIGGEVRTQLRVYTAYFDHWRRVTLELQCRLLLQRVCRGFIARNRKRFIRRIKDKATLIQSGTRKFFARRSYTQQMTRIHWAVCTIQRLVRGIQARKRVSNIVQARFDHEKRLLQRKRNVWMYWRRVRAMLGIQLYCRRYLKRVAETKAEEQAARIAKMEKAMADEAEKARVAEEVYKANLSAWYVERKAAYDLDVMNEHQTLADRKLILDRRGKAAALERAQKQQERDEKLARIEEEKTDIWLRTWEEKIARLGQEQRARCQRVLVLPETPDDLILKNDLQKRIKAQIKDVLRRADKMKIPMEIPEAFENATKEIIDFEVEAEMNRWRDVMKAEAEAIQKAEEEKARKARDDEERARQRRKKWAAMTMQGYVRSFLARRLLRQRAYKRFAKYFDVASHNYYYEDKRTHVMSWVKPAALGSYDIEMENYWIVMRATTADGTPIMHTVETPVETSVDPENPGSSEEGEKTLREVPLVYYYNPSTWRQTWERPEGTVLCEECNLEFAKRLLNYDQVKYCEFCFAGHAQALVDSGMHPKYVTFKAFQGGSENATRTDFFNTPDDSWFMLILDMNPALKQSEEEEVAAIKRARKRLEARGSTKSAKSAKSSVSASGSVYSPRAGVPKALLELCGICDDKIAVLTCVECATLYCKPCCDMEHSIASHAFHTISTYAPELPEDENGGGENQSALVPHAPLLTPSTGIEAGKKKRRKSHKPDKKSKPKASAALESGPEDTDGADADDEAFLSRPNYGTNYGTDYGTSGGDGGDQGDHDERSRTSGRSPKKDKKSKKEAKKDKKSRWSKDAASDFGDSGTERDGDTSTVGSKKSHHRKKKKDKGDKETTRAFVNSDTEGESTSPNKHKKHKRSKGDPGGTAEESEATGSTHRSKHKKKKASKSKSEDSGPGEESVQSRHHKHKSKHRSKSPADEVDVSDGYATANTAGTDGGSSSKSRSKGHKSKSKHNSKEKNKDKERGKHSRQSGDESGLDTSAFSGLSDTDTGYDTTASSRVKKDKKKKHHKSKSKDKSTDGGGYSGVDSGADTPKKKHKHVKHRAEKFPEKPQDSNREGAGDLGGDLVDAFAGMGVSDAEANYGVSSPEHSERSKSHHKRLKKHKKDTKDKGDESAVSVVSAVDDLDYVAPDSKSPEKKRKKHKTGSADKAVQLGGEKLKPMSAPEQHAHHHKHKKDKKSRSGGGRSDGDDGSFRSSSFKLPDIFQRNGVASAGAGAGGAASEGGEMFGAESGGIFGKKGHKKKKKNHKEHKEKGKEKKKRHSDAETTDQSEPEDRDNKKKAKRHKSEGDRSDPGAESSPSKPHKAYKAHK